LNPLLKSSRFCFIIICCPPITMPHRFCMCCSELGEPWQGGGQPHPLAAAENQTAVDSSPPWSLNLLTGGSSPIRIIQVLFHHHMLPSHNDVTPFVHLLQRAGRALAGRTASGSCSSS
jgi:hypothetical protein